MADLKACKKYDECGWRKSVGYCPENCTHFHHKDEVIVIRCKDCKHTETDGCADPAIYCQKWDRWEMPEDFFCAYGERRTE